MAGRTKTRYTDKELERFKKLILQKMDQAKQDLDLLKALQDFLIHYYFY